MMHVAPQHDASAALVALLNATEANSGGSGDISRTDRKNILRHVCAITWRIEELIEAGSGLEDARRVALKHYTFAASAGEHARTIKSVIYGLTPADLRAETQEAMDSRLYADVLAAQGVRDSWWRRMRWKVGRA